MERTSVGYSWRGPHGRLDPLDQRSPARARSFAHSLARPPGHTGPAASRGEPVRRHDEWSAHYGEVPATKSRDEMSPFACERRVSIRRGEARRDRDSGEVDAGDPPYNHWVNVTNRMARTRRHLAHWIALVVIVNHGGTRLSRQLSCRWW